MLTTSQSEVILVFWNCGLTIYIECIPQHGDECTEDKWKSSITKDYLVINRVFLYSQSLDYICLTSVHWELQSNLLNTSVYTEISKIFIVSLTGSRYKLYTTIAVSVIINRNKNKKVFITKGFRVLTMSTTLLS